MCIALAGFLLAGHDPALCAASSVPLGVTYGLAYPLIQAQAADGAPAGLRQQALWSFGLAYFAGLYGFPLIADVVIVAGGCQALIAVLLAAAALELAVSVRTRHAPAHGNAPTEAGVRPPQPATTSHARPAALPGRPGVDWRRGRSYQRQERPVAAQAHVQEPSRPEGPAHPGEEDPCMTVLAG